MIQALIYTVGLIIIMIFGLFIIAFLIKFLQVFVKALIMEFNLHKLRKHMTDVDKREIKNNERR